MDSLNKFEKSILSIVDDLINRDVFGDTYNYNNLYNVPRVSDILKNNSNSEEFSDFANRLGFQKKKYDDILKVAALKGTYTHNEIEKFLNTGIVNEDFSYIDVNSIRKVVEVAYKGFLDWFHILLNNNTVEVVGTEQTVVCPMYGGTIDILLRINGKLFVVDIKTTNNLSEKHFYQLAAYDIILNQYNNIQTDGVIILKLNKYKVGFDEYVLMKDNEYDNNMINIAKETFLSMMYSYYSKTLFSQYYNNRFFNN